MCAHTRHRFTLSPERVLGEWSQNPCYLQGKYSLYRNKFSSEEIEPTTLYQAGQRAQHTTNKLFRPLDILQRGRPPRWLSGKASTSRAAGLGSTASLAKWLRRPFRKRKVRSSNPACDGVFTGSSHTSDLKIGTTLATLPGAWHHRVRAGTGRPGVGIL